MRVILRGATVMALDGRRTLKKSDVLIDDGVIAAAGGTLDTQETQIFDVEGVLMPGLVDAHVHVEQALLDKHFVPDLDPHVYHHAQIAAWRAALDADALDVSASVAFGLGLMSGTTTFAQAGHASAGPSLTKAASRLGARLVLGIDGANQHAGAEIAVLEEQAKAEARTFLAPAVWGGDAERTTRRGVRLAVDAAHHTRVPLMMHLGMLPQDRGGVRRIERLDAFEARVVLAHANGAAIASQRDAERLASAEASVVLTPSFDILSGAPSPPLETLLAAEVNLALGAETGATRCGFDLFRDVRLLRRLLVGRADRPASRALEIATRGGGKALGLGVGSIEVGHRADLLLVDVTAEEGEGHEEVARRIVEHGGSDLVKSVWVDGRNVVHNGRLLDGAVPPESARDHVRARMSPHAGARGRSALFHGLVDWLGRNQRHRAGWHAGRLPFGR
ncbi:MAG: amidohydrolase family protein [Deltaproteobacteria bacterium]